MDGRVISVISHPTPDGSGWVVTHEDITERRLVEQERDRSQAFATTVIENVPATIIVKDIKSLRYVLINRAGEEYLGLPREKVIGKTAEEVFPPAIAANVAERDRMLLEDGEAQFIDEHPSETPAGAHRVITTVRVPIRNSNGEPQYLLSVIEDMHRPQARRSADRAHGASRCADRSAEPRGLRRASAIDASTPLGQAKALRGAVHRPRPLQGGQRRVRPRRSATRCCASVAAPAGGGGRRVPGAARRRRIHPDRHRRRAAGGGRRSSPTGCSTAVADEFEIDGQSLRIGAQHRHRDLPGRRRGRRDAARQCRRRALSRQGARAAARSASSRPTWTSGCASGARCSTTCSAAIERGELIAALSAAGARSTARSSASRRWCAGSIRCAASFRRQRSSRWPRKAA